MKMVNFTLILCLSVAVFCNMYNIHKNYKSIELMKDPEWKRSVLVTTAVKDEAYYMIDMFHMNVGETSLKVYVPGYVNLNEYQDAVIESLKNSEPMKGGG